MPFSLIIQSTINLAFFAATFCQNWLSVSSGSFDRQCNFKTIELEAEVKSTDVFLLVTQIAEEEARICTAEESKNLKGPVQREARPFLFF